jgi:hypothetical protein
MTGLAVADAGGDDGPAPKAGWAVADAGGDDGPAFPIVGRINGGRVARAPIGLAGLAVTDAGGDGVPPAPLVVDGLSCGRETAGADAGSAAVGAVADDDPSATSPGSSVRLTSISTFTTKRAWQHGHCNDTILPTLLLSP